MASSSISPTGSRLGAIVEDFTASGITLVQFRRRSRSKRLRHAQRLGTRTRARNHASGISPLVFFSDFFELDLPIANPVACDLVVTSRPFALDRRAKIKARNCILDGGRRGLPHEKRRRKCQSKTLQAGFVDRSVLRSCCDLIRRGQGDQAAGL